MSLDTLLALLRLSMFFALVFVSMSACETEPKPQPTVSAELKPAGPEYDCLGGVCLNAKVESMQNEVVTVAGRKWLRTVEVCSGKIVIIGLKMYPFTGVEPKDFPLPQGAVVEKFETKWSHLQNKANPTEYSPRSYAFGLVEAHEHLGWVFSEPLELNEEAIWTQADAKHPSRLGERSVFFLTGGSLDEEMHGIFSLFTTHPDYDPLCRPWFYQGL